MEPVYIMVYGTLKRGHSNHRVMGESEFIAIGHTMPHYTMFTNGSFPIVSRKGSTSIKGELFKVHNEQTLQRIFSLEGYSGTQGSPNNWYDTDTVKIGNIEALMFVQNPEQISNHLTMLPSGVF